MGRFLVTVRCYRVVLQGGGALFGVLYIELIGVHSTGNHHPAIIPSERRLTVGTQFYEYPNRTLEPRPARRVPWLQMRGDWLAAAGFDIQDPVRVRVMPSCLVVTIDEA